MPWHENATVAAMLRERIDFERETAALEIGIDPHRQSMRQAIGLAANGATHIRSHVDIDPTHGLTLVEGIMRDARDAQGHHRHRDRRLPAIGRHGDAGTVELLDQALSQWLRGLGGIDPCGIDRDPKGQLDVLLRPGGQARRADRHPSARSRPISAPSRMELIFERIRANGMQGKVAISHAFALGMNDYRPRRKLIEQIADLDIAHSHDGRAVLRRYPRSCA